MPDEKDPAGQPAAPDGLDTPPQPDAATPPPGPAAPPIIVSASGVPVVGDGASSLPGAWSPLLPPPRDPNSGPWDPGTPTITPRDQDSQLSPGTADHEDVDADEFDDDEVEWDARPGADAMTVVGRPPGERADEAEDEEPAAPSWQRDLSSQRPRRRQLAPEVRVAAFGVAAAVLLAVGVIVLATALRDDSSGSSTDSVAAAESVKPPATSKVGDCVYTEDGTPPARNVTLPPSGPSVDTRPATMVITTDKGTMTATLDAAKAPCTVHALRYLAEQGFFDNTTCHRMTGGAAPNISVLQCGDPTATGWGGPGFRYANENTEGVNYNRGVIAMANAGPDTNGSQFFINYADPNEVGAELLAGGYTVVGQITEGLDVLDAIVAPGVEGGGDDGQPASPPTIQSIKITQ
ncbi:MAG: peptidylprolyl isomerase [Frankia sp.]|nr:peptidylprolyl isomerase [Frankia sp.]